MALIPDKDLFSMIDKNGNILLPTSTWGPPPPLLYHENTIRGHQQQEVDPAVETGSNALLSPPRRCCCRRRRRRRYCARAPSSSQLKVYHTLDDSTTQTEVVCFAECYQKYRAFLNEDQLIVVEGEVSMDDFNNSVRIVGRELYTLDQARERYAKYVKINLCSTQPFDTEHLKQVLTQHLNGQCPVIIRYISDQIQADIKFGKKWLIKPSEMLMTLLQQQFAIGEIEIGYE